MPLYGERGAEIHCWERATPWRSWAVWPTKTRHGVARSQQRLKQRKILPLFPLADFGVEAVDLGLLQLEIVVDEEIAEACPQRLVLAEGSQRLAERARQRRRLAV